MTAVVDMPGMEVVEVEALEFKSFTSDACRSTYDAVRPTAYDDEQLELPILKKTNLMLEDD